MMPHQIWLIVVRVMDVDDAFGYSTYMYDV